MKGSGVRVSPSALRPLGAESPRSGVFLGHLAVQFRQVEIERGGAVQWPVEEEDLQRDVWFKVGLAEERDDPPAGDALDRLAILALHQPLEVLAHLDHAAGVA